jgi:hypothetical protein
MQKVGTEGFRDLVHDLTWVRALERRMLEVDKAVITDLRFPIEADMLREHDAVIIRVVKPDQEGNEHSSHRSETMQDEINADFTVINDGSIEELHKKVLFIFGLVSGLGQEPLAHTECF